MPMVRRHPDTGRLALFLGRRLKSYVIGLPLEESEALLDELWAHTTRKDFIWTHRWKPGDLVSTGTTAAPCISASPSILRARRLMHRTQTHR